MTKKSTAELGIYSLFAGLLAAVGGFAIDRLFNLIPGKLFKTPVDLSLKINGAVGLAFAISGFFNIKKLAKKQAAEKTDK